MQAPMSSESQASAAAGRSIRLSVPPLSQDPQKSVRMAELSQDTQRSARMAALKARVQARARAHEGFATNSLTPSVPEQVAQDFQKSARLAEPSRIPQNSAMSDGEVLSSTQALPQSEEGAADGHRLDKIQPPPRYAREVWFRG